MDAEPLSLGDNAVINVELDQSSIRIHGEIIEFAETQNGLFVIIDPGIKCTSIAGPVHRVQRGP